MTQVLGQPLSELLHWRKLPLDIVMGVLNQKAKEGEAYKDQQATEPDFAVFFPEDDA